MALTQLKRVYVVMDLHPTKGGLHVYGFYRFTLHPLHLVLM